MTALPEHGGGIDAAARVHGGVRADWLDLSTGINPQPYPLPALPAALWAQLPDRDATLALEAAARLFWRVPPGAAVCAGPGTSALIARIPHLRRPGRVAIPGPTYAEHAQAFGAAGWQVGETGGTGVAARVLVHPNNPDGRFHDAPEVAPGILLVIDESFCDLDPARSLIGLAGLPGVIVLKSFGKFWGLAGLRLGFAIGDPDLIAALAGALGPWPVSGPALAIGQAALCDTAWAVATRTRLTADAARLDALVGLPPVGGTTLFRLYDTADAAAAQDHLARAHIWTRRFSYNPGWLRLGLPGTAGEWDRLAAAMRGWR